MYKENDKLKMIKAIGIGVVCGIIFCSLMMVLLSFIFLKTGKLPTNTAYIMLQIIGALSAFIGSYIAVRIYKSMGLLVGVITSFVMFLIVFLAGLITCIDNISMMSVTKLVAMLCAGALGGILSVNKKKRVPNYK